MITINGRYLFLSGASNRVTSKDHAPCVVIQALDSGSWDWLVEFEDRSHLPVRTAELIEEDHDPVVLP